MILLNSSLSKYNLSAFCFISYFTEFLGNSYAIFLLFCLVLLHPIITIIIIISATTTIIICREIHADELLIFLRVLAIYGIDLRLIKEVKIENYPHGD